jgi:splicing factor 3A subunit 3
LLGQKQFAKQSVYDGHLNGKKHKKAAELLMESSTGEGGTPATKETMIPIRTMLEYNIKQLFRYLSQTRAATKNSVERKQTLTLAERAAEEQESEPEMSESEEEEEDDKIYNPLKLPLGWDGKPIPFWLYKLHGLSIEYECEICGGFVYMGRKAFEKHFQVQLIIIWRVTTKIH